MKVPTFGLKGEQGFTFIEVMVAVAILSLATVMLAQSNLLSLDVHARYANRLNIQNWMEEKIWEAKQNILESEAPQADEASGTVMIQHKDFRWKLKTEASDSDEVYLYDLNLTWKEGRGNGATSRTGYIFKKKLQT